MTNAIIASGVGEESYEVVQKRQVTDAMAFHYVLEHNGTIDA